MYHFIHKHFRIRLKKHKIIIASKKFNSSFKISHHFQSLNCFKNDHIYEKKNWKFDLRIKAVKKWFSFCLWCNKLLWLLLFSVIFKEFYYIYYIQIYSEMCDRTILKYLWMRWYDVWDGSWNNNTRVAVSGWGLDEMRLAMTWLLLKLRNRYMGAY